MIYTIIIKDRTQSVSKVLSFSSVTDVSKTLSASVSNNPVESGMPVSDHIVVNNPSFDLSGIISGYDIFNPSNELTWDGTQFNFASTPASTQKLIIEDELDEIILDGVVFTLLVSEENSFETDPQQKYESLKKSKTKEYNNCVLLNYTSNEQAGVDKATFFRLSIQQLNIAYVRKDVLTAEERQPMLVKTPRATNVNAGGASSSKGKADDADAVGLKSEDSKIIEDSKKTLADDSKAKIQLEQARLDNKKLEFEKQAYENAVTIASESGKQTRVVSYGAGYKVEHK